MVKAYYRLTKPGIVYGNLFTALAGFLYASRWHILPITLAATLLGLGCVIASACVFNNYIDRDIDSKMARTKDRALVIGTIGVRPALLFASVLGIVGILLLFYINVLTALIAFTGFIFYVIVYGIAKRASHLGTLVGSISGAVPIVVGYTAVSGALDARALILFAILALWQMPHFYAIAIYRRDDYLAAGIPVLPAKKGLLVAKVHILLYICAFVLAEALLSTFGFAGYFYLGVVLVMGVVWAWRAVKGFTAVDDVLWARKLFFLSLVALMVFSVAVSVGAITT